MSGPRVFNSNGNHNHNKPYYYHFKRKKIIKKTNHSSYNPSRNRKALWLPWPSPTSSPPSSTPPTDNSESSNNITTTKTFSREKPTTIGKSEDISTILWMVSVPDPVVDKSSSSPPAALTSSQSSSSSSTAAVTRSQQPPLIANPPSQPLIIPSHVAHALLLTR